MLLKFANQNTIISVCGSPRARDIVTGDIFVGHYLCARNIYITHDRDNRVAVPMITAISVYIVNRIEKKKKTLLT